MQANPEKERPPRAVSPALSAKVDRTANLRVKSKEVVPVQPAAFALPDSIVLIIANSFSNGGGFNWDKGSGTPEEIRFKGQRILSKAKNGTYCCGFTFAVVMRAANEAEFTRVAVLTEHKQAGSEIAQGRM
mgnify:CR=1 FL=1